MASSAAGAPSTGFRPLQIAEGWRVGSLRDGLEAWLEDERDQLVLWLPVVLAGGIAAWFLLPDRAGWAAFLLASGGLTLGGLALGRHGRAARAMAVAGVMLALGCGLIWWRAERVAAPVLARPVVAAFEARVEQVEPLPARDLVRLTLRTDGHELPARVRVNLATKDVPAGIGTEARIRLRARLMPPPGPAVPGAYDFARVAWFGGIGATGRGFAPVELLEPGQASDMRSRLSTHIQEALPGPGGAIATAFVTGDEGALPEEDANAMRRSGLAHLLSVSGLHITAVTAAAMFLALRLLALSQWLALRVRLPLVAAAAGAAAAIGYTLLTGAQVPTIRSCAAALLVLLALSLGREAVTLRLVGAGALVVLLLWPEALAGPSFQLSFAAVTAIVALHEHPRVRGWFSAREEGRGARLLRHLASLLLTGFVVELALMPIALFHFHKAGLYGALANIVAIPLTTFVVMPLEALALAFDLIGAGAPFWWLTGRALDLLLWIAHETAAAPGAVTPLPGMPAGAFALLVAGGLWVALWRTRWRWLGLLPALAGALWTLATPPPDLLVTGDGRHLAVRTPDGGMALLRDRAGDYTQSLLAENGGVDDTLALLSDQVFARCSRDLCIAAIDAGGRHWRIVATRSVYPVPRDALVRVCAEADVVVSERRLPTACIPRWLRLDRPFLDANGGVAVTFATGRVTSVARGQGRHPWVDPPTVAPPLVRGGRSGR